MRHLAMGLSVLAGLALILGAAGCGDDTVEMESAAVPTALPTLSQKAGQQPFVVFMGKRGADTFHREGCEDLPSGMPYRVARTEAVEAGAKPCPKCNP